MEAPGSHALRLPTKAGELPVTPLAVALDRNNTSAIYKLSRGVKSLPPDVLPALCQNYSKTHPRSVLSGLMSKCPKLCLDVLQHIDSEDATLKKTWPHSVMDMYVSLKTISTFACGSSSPFPAKDFLDTVPGALVEGSNNDNNSNDDGEDEPKNFVIVHAYLEPVPGIAGKYNTKEAKIDPLHLFVHSGVSQFFGLDFVRQVTPTPHSLPYAYSRS